MSLFQLLIVQNNNSNRKLVGTNILKYHFDDVWKRLYKLLVAGIIRKSSSLSLINAVQCRRKNQFCICQDYQPWSLKNKYMYNVFHNKPQALQFNNTHFIVFLLQVIFVLHKDKVIIVEITLLHIYEEKYFNVMWLCIKQIEIIQVFCIMNIQFTFELLSHIPYLLQYKN